VVIHRVLKQSSGHSVLDDAALKVAETMQFTPARNRDQQVAVWVDMPIVFKPGNSGGNRQQALTPEEQARLSEARRLENEKMKSEARGDQAATSQRAAVTAGSPDSPVTVQSRTRDAGMPVLLNAEEVSRGLQRNYPPLLRDAGIGGEVVIWFYVNTEGV